MWKRVRSEPEVDTTSSIIGLQDVSPVTSVRSTFRPVWILFGPTPVAANTDSPSLFRRPWSQNLCFPWCRSVKYVSALSGGYPLCPIGAFWNYVGHLGGPSPSVSVTAIPHPPPSIFFLLISLPCLPPPRRFIIFFRKTLRLIWITLGRVLMVT